MARFSTDGFNDVINDLAALDLSDDELDEVLLAGAEEDKKAWKMAAAMHNLKDSGDMIDSIGFSKKPTKINGIRSIDIYPQGKDSKGIKNVEKAFYLHYGTMSQASIERDQKKLRNNKKYKNPGIPTTHWVDDADELAAPLVHHAMEEKYDEFVRKRGKK